MRHRWIILSLVALFLLGPFISHLHKSCGTARGDWLSIYHIAEYTLRTGNLQVDEQTDDKLVITERYPPIARPLLLLFALLPKEISAVLSFLLFASLYAWSVVQISTLYPETGELSARTARLWPAMLVAPYIWADLTAGNLTSILLWSVTAAFVWSERGRPWRAGVALSVGILLKMIPAICLIHFALHRQWRVLAGSIAGVVFLGLLPSLAIFRPGSLAEYHSHWYRAEFAKFSPLRVIDQPVECTYQNQAWPRTMIRLFVPVNSGHAGDPFSITIAQPPRWLLKVAYLLIVFISLLAFCWVLWRTKQSLIPSSIMGSFSLCVGAMLWFSPWVASYYFSLAIWPLAAVVARMARQKSTALSDRLPWLVLLIWLLAMPGLASQFLRACSVNLLALAFVLVSVAFWLIGDSRTRGTPSDSGPVQR